MKYRITHTTKYSYSQPASVCHNMVHLSPRTKSNQSVSQFRLLVTPDPLSTSSQQDFFGNRVDYFSIPNPHLGLTISANSHVEVTSGQDQELLKKSPSWETVQSQLNQCSDNEMLLASQLSFPSRLIPDNTNFAAYAQESFAAGRPIVEACQHLTERIFREFEYDSRATTVSTPAEEVMRTKSGVCQDFAHLQIGIIRSLGLAARYVSGYLRTNPPPGQQRLVGADASHAWIGVYCGSEIGWVDFDPTNNLIPSEDHITVGWGRDYSDLCPIQGVFIGGGDSTMQVSVDVEPLEVS